MTSRKIAQQELAPKAKILASLMLLRNTYGLTGRQIAGLLGVNENYLSRVFNGKEAGSNQLASALDMLLELTKIRQEQEEAELQKKLSDGTLTVKEKVKLLRTKGKL
jgi:transcriptional regulator with XRE-family HTH domain